MPLFCTVVVLQPYLETGNTKEPICWYRRSHVYEHPHRKNKTEEIPFIFTFPLTKYYPHKSQETFILSKQKTLQTAVISFDYRKILEIMQNNYSSLWEVHFCPNFLCPHLGCLCFHHSFLHDDYVVDTFIHHKKNKKSHPKGKEAAMCGSFHSVNNIHRKKM